MFSFKFSGASQFDEDLCSWRSIVQGSLSAEDMFAGTNCPIASDPDFSTGASFCAMCVAANDNSANPPPDQDTSTVDVPL